MIHNGLNLRNRPNTNQDLQLLPPLGGHPGGLPLEPLPHPGKVGSRVVLSQSESSTDSSPIFLTHLLIQPPVHWSSNSISILVSETKIGIWNEQIPGICHKYLAKRKWKWNWTTNELEAGRWFRIELWKWNKTVWCSESGNVIEVGIFSRSNVAFLSRNLVLFNWPKVISPPKNTNLNLTSGLWWCSRDVSIFAIDNSSISGCPSCIVTRYIS